MRVEVDRWSIAISCLRSLFTINTLPSKMSLGRTLKL